MLFDLWRSNGATPRLICPIEPTLAIDFKKRFAQLALDQTVGLRVRVAESFLPHNDPSPPETAYALHGHFSSS